MKEEESHQQTINVVPLPKGLRYLSKKKKYIYIRKEFVSDRPALSSKLGGGAPTQVLYSNPQKKGEESFYVYKKYIKKYFIFYLSLIL